MVQGLRPRLVAGQEGIHQQHGQLPRQQVGEAMLGRMWGGLLMLA
jgi:hypothetical protein